MTAKSNRTDEKAISASNAAQKASMTSAAKSAKSSTKTKAKAETPKSASAPAKSKQNAPQKEAPKPVKAKAEKPVAPKADKPKKAAAKSTKASSAKTAASPAAHKPINEDASVKAAEKAYADATLTANVPAEKMLNDMKKAVDVTVEAAVVEMNATTQLSERGIQDATMNLEALMTFQKEALDSLVGATVTAVQNIEELSDQMSDLAQQRSEKQAAFFSAFCEAKDPVSLCKVHEAYVRDSYDSMIAQYTASTDIWMRIGRESMDPLSTQFARMVDHMKGLSGQ